MCVPVIDCETARLKALYQYQILDTPPEAAFDNLARLAAQICQTPIALVSFVDKQRLWFKAKIGLEALEVNRELTFCSQAILQAEPFLVEDALLDPRFAQTPLVVQSPYIRSYAAAPLVTLEGYRIGTICVADQVPRSLNLDQIEALKILSYAVMSQLDFRRSYALLHKQKQQLEVATQLATLIESSDVAAQIVGATEIAHDLKSHRQLEIRLQQALAEQSIGTLPHHSEYAHQYDAIYQEIIERKQLEAMLKHQADREQLVAEMAQRIHQFLHPEIILNTTVSEVRQFLKSDRVLIYQLNLTGGGCVVAESVGTDWRPMSGAVVYDCQFAEHYAPLYQDGRVQAIEDIYTAHLAPCHVELLERFQVRANLAVPIVTEEKLWGLLVAQQCSQPRQWQSDEVKLLKRLATQTAIAIAQSELYQQAQAEIVQRQQTEVALRQQVERAHLVNQIAQRIRQSLDLDQILNTTVSEVRQFLQADRVLTYRVTPNGTGFITNEAVAPDYPTLLEHPLPREIFPLSCYQLYQQGRVRAITDIEQDEMHPCLIETLRALGIKSKLVVPILYKEELWGLMIVHQCSQSRQWQPWESELLKQLSTHVAIAIAQANLLSQTYRQVCYEATINRMTQLLYSLNDMAAIGQTILDEAVCALDAIGGRLYITANSREQPAQLYTAGKQPRLARLEESEVWQKVVSPVSELKQRAPHLPLYSVDDLHQDPRLQPIASVFAATSICAILIVPLQYQNQCIGYLSLFRADDMTRLETNLESSHRWERSAGFESRVWSPEEIRLTQTLSTHLYLAIMQRRVEDTIRHQASHDALTELPNRYLFNERLTLELVSAQRQQEMLAVMFLDLDRFKSINDTLGHAVGDRLLQQVARRITRCLKRTDTIARWGGDEFTLILPRIQSAENAAKVAQRILDVLKSPFEFNQQELHISASIGIVLAPHDGEDTETLLKNADTAMYRAKQEGRNSFQLYALDMNMQAFDQLLLINDLYKAIERGEFLLHYQPQIDLQTQQVVAVEALIRWRHPQRGLVSPTQFIAIAEEIGQIRTIGEWVLQTACAQNRVWQLAGLPPVRVAVNLSGRQFQQKDLARSIAQILAETGLEPQYLEVEITESIAMQNLPWTLSVLEELQDMGVYISIDDFGTGYSSLATLKQFPLHTLKIAREFIQDLATSPADAAVIQAIVALGHGLNLSVVAEGVETLAQWSFLKSVECNAMQGYFFSKPLPATAVIELISRNLISAREASV